jgi:hypothetical protein
MNNLTAAPFALPVGFFVTVLMNALSAVSLSPTFGSWATPPLVSSPPWPPPGFHIITPLWVATK